MLFSVVALGFPGNRIGCHAHGLLEGRGRGWRSETACGEMEAKTRPTTITRSEQRVIVAQRSVIGQPAEAGYFFLVWAWWLWKISA